MDRIPHQGLRGKLLATVIVIVGLVMLPVLMLGDRYLVKQASAEAEGQLKALSRLAHDLVETQYATLGNGLSQLADAMALRYGGAYSAAPRPASAPDFFIDGVPVSGRTADLSRYGGDHRGTMAAMLARAGDTFRVIASTRWGDDEIAPVLHLETSTLRRLEAGERWRGDVMIRERLYLLELVPARDAVGHLVGLMAVGVDLLSALKPLRERLRTFVVGNSGYLYVVDANPGPGYGRFVSHPLQTGDTPLAPLDETGRQLVKDMLARPQGVIAYDWRNPAKAGTEAHRKLVAFERSESLGWVIGASGYVDEFGRSAVRLRYGVGIAMVLMAVLLMFGLKVAIERMVMRPMLRLQRTLRTLSRGNEALVHSEDESTLASAICRILVHTGGFRLALIDSLESGGSLKRVAAAGAAGHLCAALEVGEGRMRAPALSVLAAGQPVYLTSGEHIDTVLRDAAMKDGCEAMIAFPLRGGGRLLGLLTIGASHLGDLDHGGVALLAELAEDLGYGLMSLRGGMARKVAERALILRERAIEATRDGVLILQAEDGGFVVRDANAAAGKILGMQGETVIGLSSDVLGVLDRGGAAALDGALRSLRESVLELEGIRSDGTSFWSECAVEPVRGEDSDYVVLVIKDVTERVRYLQQLEHQAHFDPLTGLPNRSLLNDRLEQAIITAKRHQRVLAVAYLDLDHFKRINDDLGHRTGDRLLLEVALRLRGVLRDGDTAARQGGDEFVVLLPDLDGEEQAYAVLCRLQQVLAAPVEIEGRQFFVTTSIGVSLYPRDGDEDETLLKRADIAMYQAKAAGRDAIRFFISEMNEQVQDRLMVEQALRHALENGELSVVYQPQICARTGHVIAAEALLRWTHPELGVVLPARFIPLAEELGLIEGIGEWVLRVACEQALAWHAAGTPLRVAVNVSARQFRSENLPERVAAILEVTGLKSELLELELTESMLMGKVDQAEAMLRRLKALGVTIALDDFGTGYSSFAYIQHFPIDTLKVDQTFVRAMLTGKSAVAIVSAIIALAHNLGMRVIAEGVEMESQRQQLVDLGCDELQGYLLGRPVPGADFVAV
ncbi:MAG: EAL domain-containing protein [Azoarcus sp.]|jgi:diguanylate cyclase (GGDEF)-like protein/PAS domain S-box-containing protein|nr:EAL domain-containing protein [Azoarcus sp.]